MIESVEILNKEEIIEVIKPLWLQLFPLAYSLIVLFICFALFMIAKKHDMRRLGLGVLIIYIIFGIGFDKPLNNLLENKFSVMVATGRYQYRVRVSDATDIKEIHEKYEVVRVDGDVYIIMDKEN